jgi:fumarylacetoacetase
MLLLENGERCMSIEIDETHDPARESWVPSARRHAQFPIQNLPYGIFAPADAEPRPGVAIGDAILDIGALARAGLLPEPAASALGSNTLNALFGLPSAARRALRRRLSQLLTDRAHEPALATSLHEATACTLHLPVLIGDYSDFYVGIHHAMNVGRIFRPDTPLMPNYKHLPIGYHGRASSVRVSGTPVRRPLGQTAGPDNRPNFAPTRQLDYELELGIFIGEGNSLGERIELAKASQHMAGLCLLNDWSARDVQAWERLPLGPFLSKSFQTSISPWVISTEALVPFRIAPPSRPEGDPKPLPYLEDATDRAGGQYALNLEVSLLTSRMRDSALAPERISRTTSTVMYFTFAQIVAHQASNGCNLNPGDLLGTGTLSGPTREGSGSLLELSGAGTQPLRLANGETRRFLEDGDEVMFTATAEAPGRVSIGFGSCRGVVLPSH